MKTIKFITAIAFFTTFLLQAKELKIPYVEKMCPFTCCQYGAWSVIKGNHHVLDKKNADAETLFSLDKGASFEAVEGEIHSIPGNVHAVKEFSGFKKGQDIELLYYVDHGQWFGWYQGEKVDVNLTCVWKKLEDCWGNVTKKPKVTWWIRIKSDKGEGWLKTVVGDSFFQSFRGFQAKKCG